ncbi:MAG: septum formation initiator family protein [Deltaproteobacteria bacterium]|nr:septum formation initiator family protein [Deltaproteobacteria bacterium]
MSEKLKKILKIPLILLCFTVPIAGWICYGDGGMIRLCRTGVERRECFDRIRKLVAENQVLIEEVHRFRTDMTYVESVARNELSLIRKNEVIYRFRKGSAGD